MRAGNVYVVPEIPTEPDVPTGEALTADLQKVADENKTFQQDESIFDCMTEKDFLNVWVYHTGEFWPDFNNFFKNEHPIVGMCYAHKENPYSRSEKRIVELNMIMVCFMMAVLFDDSDSDGSASFLFTLLATTIWSTINIQMAKCGCCYWNGCPAFCTSCGECLSKQALRGLTFLSLIFLIIGLVAATGNGFISSFLGARATGYMQWFLVQLGYSFRCKWAGQKKKTEQFTAELNDPNDGLPAYGYPTCTSDTDVVAFAHMCRIARRQGWFADGPKVAREYHRFISSCANMERHTIHTLHTTAFLGWIQSGASIGESASEKLGLKFFCTKEANHLPKITGEAADEERAARADADDESLGKAAETQMKKDQEHPVAHDFREEGHGDAGNL